VYREAADEGNRISERDGAAVRVLESGVSESRQATSRVWTASD